MADRIVLDGELSLNIPLDGEAIINSQIDGETDNVIKIDRTIEPLTITENGEYDAGDGGYNPIIVQVPPWSDELYPVGADIVAMYLGRNWANGDGNFVRGTVNTKTGEFTQTDVSTDNGLCMVYIPIDPSYTYVKNNAGRIFSPCVYDENYNFIKQLTQNLNNLSWTTFQQFPENARYFRFATHAITNNWDICIFRTA